MWVIAIILEIVAVALSFAYSENVTESAENRYRDSWEKAIMDYGTEKAAKDVVDAIQKNVMQAHLIVIKFSSTLSVNVVV